MRLGPRTAADVYIDKHNKGSDLTKRNSRATPRGSNTNNPSHAQQTANGAALVNTAPNMDARRSNTPDKQVEAHSQSQTPNAQSQKSSSRSYDIVGSTQEVQAVPQETGFGKPKRVNTNSSLKEVAADNEYLRRENAELSEHIAHMHQINIQQDSSNHNERLYQAESELPRLRAQIREWQDKARVAQNETESLGEDLRKQRLEAKATIESLTFEHNQNKAESEAKIRRLLDGATRDRVDGRWNPPPDEDIKRRLLILNDNMRDWARTWATKSFVVDKAVSKETVKYFSDFVRLDPDNNFPLLFRKPSAKMKEKVAGLLLHAALAHEVHDAFFDGKIFCLKTEEREVVENLFRELKKGESWIAIVSLMFTKFASADPKNAYIWRAGLWRLLNPPAPEDSLKVPAILETTRNNVKTYCDAVSTSFRKKPANILFAIAAENGPEAQNRAAKLRTILQQASAIATSLWTQHSWFTAVDLSGIYSSKMTFDNGSLLLQAHPWSNVDEDSDQFNGTGILLVVRPGLLAFDADDTSGIQGDRYRVLVRAIVLLDGKY